MALNKYLSIITLNVNGLNAPIKGHRVAEWIRKHEPHICGLQKSYLRTDYLPSLKVKEWNIDLNQKVSVQMKMNPKQPKIYGTQQRQS